MSWQAHWIALLSWSLVRSLVLAAAGYILLRVFRVRHPAAQHSMWTAVLIGIIVLPILTALAPRLELAVLPRASTSNIGIQPLGIAPEATSAQASNVSENVAVVTESSDPRIVQSLPAMEPSKDVRLESPAPASTKISWPQTETLLFWFYVTGVVAVGAFQVVGWLLMRRVVAQSRLQGRGPIRESDDVIVPVAVGLLRPKVILPNGWRRWSLRTRRFVLAHEFAHIRRHDLRISALARVARCLLWFDPLVWWVTHRIAQLAEMASDAAVLERAGNPADYARMLLDFAGRVNRVGYRAALSGMTIASPSGLSQRIDRLFQIANGSIRKRNWTLTRILLAGTPVVCLIAMLSVTEMGSPIPIPVSLARPEPEPQASRAGAAPVVSPVSVQATQPAPDVKAFLDRYCVSCHSGKLRAAFALTLDDKDLSQIGKNAEVWEKVVRKLKSGLEPPVSITGPKLEPGVRKAIVAWLENELDRGAPAYLPAPGLHRLNRAEYGNAIKDLLGFDIDSTTLLPMDDSTSGFDNIAGALVMSPELAAAYVKAAASLSEKAIVSTKFVCRPVTDSDDAACARKVIENLVTHAFRRPVSADELNAFVEIYQFGRRSWADRSLFTRYPYPRTPSPFEHGIEIVLRDILTDRKFLYRREIEPANLKSGQGYRISDMELASRLSFFLWSRGPDDQLIDLARRGQLQNAVVLEQQVRRMLKDSRADALAANFAGQWLGLRRLQNLPSLPAYPDLDEPLKQAMRREGELFFDSIVREDRNVLDLLTADYTFVNERLARHYGIPNIQGAQFRRVTFGPELDVRRGLLGKASYLTTLNRFDQSRTSIVFRGKWILYALLGVSPPDPPPTTPDIPMKTDGGPAITGRQKLQDLEVDGACRNCHKIVDPIGFALENFDPTGKWRTLDEGLPIDASGELLDGTRINGPADLRNALLGYSDQFVQNMAQRLLTYALGRGTRYGDMPVVRSIARDASRNDNRFSAIVVSIVKSRPFQMNAKD